MIFDSHPLPDRYRHASKVRIHTWRRSVPQRGSVGSADTELHTGLMRTATQRYRVTVLTVSNNDFRLSSLSRSLQPLPQQSGFTLGGGQYRNAVASGPRTLSYIRA